MKKLLIIPALLIILLASSCQIVTGAAPLIGSATENTTPQSATVPPPPLRDWQEGSPPPAGIGGRQQPGPLTQAEKERVIEITLKTKEAADWLQGPTDYRTGPVDWYAIVWNDGEAEEWWVLEYDRVASGQVPDFSPYAYWYPGFTIAVGEGTIYQMQIAVDLDAGKAVIVEGPYPSLSSPDRFRMSTTTSTDAPAIAPSISREQAIETSAKTLPASIVARADITAEVHGWYWEIVFDNLNARADELIPFPLKGPPPPPLGHPIPDPYPGIWESVIITVDIETGNMRSAGARKAPRPGPYVSQELAIESAREFVSGFPTDVSWIDKTSIEAYLQGDIWIVLFWENGSNEYRLKASVDAVTGDATGGGIG